MIRASPIQNVIIFLFLNTQKGEKNLNEVN